MSTTTIRLPEDLRARVAHAAEAAGITSHEFILDAIVEKVISVEQHADFHAIAQRRYAQFLESGESVPWEEVRTYLMQRLAGKNAKHPLAERLTR